jgi:hypothetical protein
MSESKRTWLTADEFLAECERRRAEVIASRQMPQPASLPSPPIIYQLNPYLKYRPNKLDSSDYPGKVVYRRSTIEDVGAVPVRGGAAPRPAAGLVKIPPNTPARGRRAPAPPPALRRAC